MDLTKTEKEELLVIQCYEITEKTIFENLAKKTKDQEIKDVLLSLAASSVKHYEYLKKFTGKDVKPSNFLVWWHGFLAKTAGLTFAIKLMERREEKAERIYEELVKTRPEFSWIINEEHSDEQKTISLIKEEILDYISSVVLGLSDALVELTGALAGFTLAMQNSKLIASAGLITGIAASLSMAASEYLSTKAEKLSTKKPLRAAIYTGITYITTVALLITPYFIFANYLVSLGVALIIAFFVILIFTFYSAVAQSQPFGKRLLENVSISFGVATITFLIGYLVRTFLHIEI